MIRAFTSSYPLDLDMAIRLNKQLVAHGVDHHVFVENQDVAVFAPHFPGSQLHEKPPGGDGGLGRAGSMCRWHILHHMLSVVQDGDTAVNIDSDVVFLNEKLIDELACSPGEVKGFTGDSPGVPPIPIAGEGTFHPMSGMLIAAASDVFKRSMDISQDDVWAICQRLMDNGHGCSEDVVASYLYQIRGKANVTAFQEVGYVRSVRGPTYSRAFPEGYLTDVDVIA
jgi:hypothetical protein